MEYIEKYSYSFTEFRIKYVINQLEDIKLEATRCIGKMNLINSNKKDSIDVVLSEIIQDVDKYINYLNHIYIMEDK